VVRDTRDSDLLLERDFLLRLLELSHHDEPRPFIEEALELIVRLCGADRGYLEIYAPGSPDEAPRYAAARGGLSHEVVRETLSSSIISEVLAQGGVVETAAAVDDARFADRESVQRNQIEAVLCVPIGAPPSIGVLYLQGGSHAGGLRERGRPFVELFARHLAPVADRIVRQARLDEEDPTARWRSRLGRHAENIIGRSHALADVLKAAALAAPLDMNVLITGPSGSGKSMLAEAIARTGPRADKPFVSVNCSTIPDTLVESELFGALPGSHSTATRRIRGKVDAAQKGTLFLDEVAELSMPAQAKLLQLVQSKSFYPLGGIEPQEADVRLIVATNADLLERVLTNRFREDLYYRLRVLEITMPPLASRRSDIALLAEQFLSQTCGPLGRTLRFSGAALRRLEIAEWSGDIRELQHTVTAAAVRILADDVNLLEPYHLFPGDPVPNHQGDFREAVREFQRRYLLDALEEHDWNVSSAAQSLGIARSHVYNLIRTLGLARP